MSELTFRKHLNREDRFQSSEIGYAVESENGTGILYSNDYPACTFLVQDERQWRRLIKSDAYGVARAFIRSEFEVYGDLIEATKIFRKLFLRSSRWGLSTIASYLRQQLGRQLRNGSSAEDIRFHYDRSNEFFRCFLDTRMVYSCAYFTSPQASLESAQIAKLEHICRKLHMRPGDRFLDVGCGWGALVLHSAHRFGTFSTGCTLSENQRAWAAAKAELAGLPDRVSFVQRDYREMSGTFERIASVGMFEHVGNTALAGYFQEIARLLAEDGLFLNHGIVRPSTHHAGPETIFLSRYVFPGSELVQLTDVIRCAEQAGLEVIDVENLRPHYALTCRAWVDRLTRNRAECLDCVDSETYRTWLLYLAASCASFEAGELEIHQTLLAKRGASRPLTREYVYS